MLVLAALLLLNEDFPATIPDPGFEMGLRDWADAGHAGYRALAAANVPGATGRRSLSVGWAARNRAPPGAEYRVYTLIDGRSYRGRTLRLSARVRVRGGGESSLAAVTGHGRVTEARLRPGNRWGRQGVVFIVPRGAGAIEVEFHLKGNARLEADDVRLDVLR